MMLEGTRGKKRIASIVVSFQTKRSNGLSQDLKGEETVAC